MLCKSVKAGRNGAAVKMIFLIWKQKIVKKIYGKKVEPRLGVSTSTEIGVEHSSHVHNLSGLVFLLLKKINITWWKC